jgi:hypothetical protein
LNEINLAHSKRDLDGLKEEGKKKKDKKRERERDHMEK